MKAKERKPDRPPAGYITLDKAKAQAGKHGLGSVWFLREFRLGWIVPVVGFNKLRRGFWQGAHITDEFALSLIESGRLSLPHDEWAPIYNSLDGQPLFISSAEFAARLSVASGGHMITPVRLARNSKVQARAAYVKSIALRFDDDMPRRIVIRPATGPALGYETPIYRAFTPDVPLARVQSTLPDATAEDLARAFSSPLAEAEFAWTRFREAAGLEETERASENPLPYPILRASLPNRRVTVCEALTWFRCGEAIDYPQIENTWGDLSDYEFKRRWQALENAEGPFTLALAEGRLAAQHDDGGADIPADALNSPWRTFDLRWIDDSGLDVLYSEQPIPGEARRVEFRFRRVTFKPDGLWACWPNKSAPLAEVVRAAGDAHTGEAQAKWKATKDRRVPTAGKRPAFPAATSAHGAAAMHERWEGIKADVANGRLRLDGRYSAKHREWHADWKAREYIDHAREFETIDPAAVASGHYDMVSTLKTEAGEWTDIRVVPAETDNAVSAPAPDTESAGAATGRGGANEVAPIGAHDHAPAEFKGGLSEGEPGKSGLRAGAYFDEIVSLLRDDAALRDRMRRQTNKERRQHFESAGVVVPTLSQFTRKWPEILKKATTHLDAAEVVPPRQLASKSPPDFTQAVLDKRRTQ